MTEPLATIVPQAELVWTSPTVRPPQDSTSTAFDQVLKAAEIQLSRDNSVQVQESAETVRGDSDVEDEPVWPGGHGRCVQRPDCRDTHSPSKAGGISDTDVPEGLGLSAEDSDEAPEGNEHKTAAVGGQVVQTYVGPNPLAAPGSIRPSSPGVKSEKAHSELPESGSPRTLAPRANRLNQYGVATPQTASVNRALIQGPANGGPERVVSMPAEHGQYRADGTGTARAGLQGYEARSDSSSVYGRSHSQVINPHSVQTSASETGISVSQPNPGSRALKAEPSPLSGHEMSEAGRSVVVPISTSNPVSDFREKQGVSTVQQPVVQGQSQGKLDPYAMTNRAKLGSSPTPVVEHRGEVPRVRTEQTVIAEPMSSIGEGHHSSILVDNEPSVWSTEVLEDSAELESQMSKAVSSDPNSTPKAMRTVRAEVSSPKVQAGVGLESVPVDQSRVDGEAGAYSTRASAAEPLDSWVDHVIHERPEMTVKPRQERGTVEPVRLEASSPRVQTGAGLESVSVDKSRVDGEARANSARVSAGENLDDAADLNALRGETMQSVPVRAVSDSWVRTGDSLRHNPVGAGRTDTVSTEISAVNHADPRYGSMDPHPSTSKASVDAAEPKAEAESRRHGQSAAQDLQLEAAPVRREAGNEVKVRQVQTEDEHSRVELHRDLSLWHNTAADQRRSSVVARREAQVIPFRPVRQKQEGVHQSSGRGVQPQASRSGYSTDRDLSVRMDAIQIPESYLTEGKSAGAYVKTDMLGVAGPSESADTIRQEQPAPVVIAEVQSRTEIEPSNDRAKDIPDGGSDYAAGSPKDEIMVKATRVATRNHDQVNAVKSKPSIEGSHERSSEEGPVRVDGSRLQAQAGQAETESRQTVPSRPASFSGQARVQRVETPGPARLELPEPIVREQAPLHIGQDGQASSRMLSQSAVTEAERVSAAAPLVNASRETASETRRPTKAGINARPEDKAATEIRESGLQGHDGVRPVSAAEMQSGMADPRSGNSDEASTAAKALVSRGLTHERPATTQGSVNGGSAVSVRPAQAIGPIDLRQPTARVSSDIVDQIVKHAGFRASENGGEIRIQLVPEHLGRVEMRVRLAGGICTASVRVENVEVGKYLQQHVAELKTSMIEHGVNIGAINVFVGSERRDGSERRHPDYWSSQVPVTYPSFRQPEKATAAERVKTSLIDYIA